MLSGYWADNITIHRHARIKWSTNKKVGRGGSLFVVLLDRLDVVAGFVAQKKKLAGVNFESSCRDACFLHQRLFGDFQNPDQQVTTLQPTEQFLDFELSHKQVQLHSVLITWTHGLNFCLLHRPAGPLLFSSKQLQQLLQNRDVVIVVICGAADDRKQHK